MDNPNRHPWDRRRFLQAAPAFGLGAALAPAVVLRSITPARADMEVGPDAVRFRPEIEPVVRWIEQTPRDKVFDVAVEQLKAGLSYRDFLGGLFLAGIRNVKPRPVGFKFHTVMVIHSAHLLSQSADTGDRLLPLFWALDNFKNSQAQDVKEGDWTLGKVDESKVPSPDRARAAFAKAMDGWDSEAADVATAGLCRASGAADAMEPFWRYGIRDQRNIGHKAIFAAQAWRTLQTIGWAHAEPVLRSLAFAILDLQGDQNKAPVGPYDANMARSKTIRAGWQVGKTDPAATIALLEALRQAEPEQAASEAAALLDKGVSPGSVWDGILLAAGEIMMRKPGIVAIHAMTSANALHYIYGASGDETTRKLAILQAASWVPMFRQRAETEEGVRIDAIEPQTPAAGKGDEAIGEIYETLSRDRNRAGQLAAGYLAAGGSPEKLLAAGRRLIFRKGRDSHDYKYGAAAWEECFLATDPARKAPLAVAAMFNAPSTEAPESPVMKRAREAVARV